MLRIVLLVVVAGSLMASASSAGAVPVPTVNPAALPLTVDTTTTEATPTRHEKLRSARERSRQHVHPPRPTSIERTVRFIEDDAVPALLEFGVGGFYVAFGGFPVGSGTGARANYTPFFREKSLNTQLRAGLTLRGYWTLDATARLERGWFFTQGYTSFRLRPESFVATPTGAPTDVDIDVREFIGGGMVGAQLHSRWAVATGLSYQTADPRRAPALDFTPVRPPGAEVEDLTTARYLRYQARLEWDSRDVQHRHGIGDRFTPRIDPLTERPFHPRHGTFVSAHADRFQELSAVDGTFNQVTAEVQHYRSFWNAYHTLALRHRSVFTGIENNARVPFYQLPHVGGPYTLRGFRNFRFRGRHTLLFNAEYRWRVWHFADMVLFGDAGKAMDDAASWGFTNLQASWGGGLRVAAGTDILLRLEVARSHESTQLILGFSSAF